MVKSNRTYEIPCGNRQSLFIVKFRLVNGRYIYEGYEISPHYDSMFGKLITWGVDREEAIDRMLSALSEVIIEGIKHNVEFHKRLLNDPRVRSGDFSTKFLEEIFTQE